MIKLVAFDIDDTITKGSTTLPPENVLAVRRAQKAGVFVTIATGRGFLGSSEIWKTLRIEGPVINYGGSIINDTRTGKPLYVTSFKPEEVREVFAIAHELGVHAQLYQGDSIVYEHENQYAINYRAFLNLPYRIDPDLMQKDWENVPKIIYITEKERACELIPVLQKHFEGRLKVSGSKAGFVEFNEISAHKGSALEWVAAYMGVKREEVAAMGDNLLDLEMIQWAGVGAAVADANPAVLEIADVVAPRCEDMGAAWFLDNIVLKGEGNG